MGGTVVVAAGLAAGAVWLMGAGAPGRQRPAGTGPPGGSDVGPRASPVGGAAAHPTDSRRWARPASVLAGFAAWLLLGGPVGLFAGAGLAVGLSVFLGRLESGSARRRRVALVQAAPVVADLLAAALTAGVPLERAVPVVAGAVGGPAGDLLASVRTRMELGEAADAAWAGIGRAPGLGDLARTVARSARTGAPLAGLLATSADELRAKAAADALVEVRKAGVRSVLPLGLCLLPAFVLLGIVPVVGGLLPSF